jgi:hypothetical protein
MDTPIEEQQVFQNVTCNIAASESEITEANTLSIDFLSYVSQWVVYRTWFRLLFFLPILY